ncbi:MAG: hypothetical protein WD771_04980 [Gemmatimonadaceae bacterium]
MLRRTLGRSFAFAAVLAAALVTPRAAASQALAAPAAPEVAAPEVAAPAPGIGPVRAPAGVTRSDDVSATATADALSFQNRGPGNRNVQWMIIGGGLLLGGVIVGDDVGTILAVGGLVIGGIGLWRYLQ